MVDDSIESFLWWLTLSEILFLIILFFMLIGDILGYNQLFNFLSYKTKIIAVLFLVIELLIPFIVYIDVKRTGDQINSIWIHASAMPIVNIFGIIAYLIQKNQKLNQ